ncbi:hypothetical protein [Lysobacter solisilvae (ex Woo and Kim 2020)]|uniref:Lipoprotein n=1 Tax=Agrilutibacter terrestris TaxID=2865112 RepID=A0A7H0FVN5_9GAMM|nr:hypothetical protein [Lysobacter terrestris]QNP40101.1 hypothetical protein H8B22_11435 [Lysobacter terrestris]
MKTPIPFLAVALSLVLAACSQAESRDATRPADAVIGIVQCDAYLAAVNTCIQDKVPADKRAALTAEAHQMFTTWKEAAADPQQRSTLPQACGITRDVAKEELAGYGCAL